MRWILLLAVLSGICWTADWSYHQLNQTFLITDYWETQERIEEWGLVNFKGNEPQVYAFSGTNKFWPIFQNLWPIWALFTLIFIVLIPLSIYIYNNFNDAQITAARKFQEEAEQQAKKAMLDAQNHKLQMTSWAEEKVNKAYEEQLCKAKKELETEWAGYHKQKNALLERESTIRLRERAAQEKEEWATQQVAEIQKQYQQKKTQFDEDLRESTKAKNNAQSGHMRLKKEKLLIKDFLKNEGWTIDNNPLTYEQLKSLAKAKQPF